MTEATKKSAGRPRKYSGRRPTWTIRLEDDVGNRVKEIATNSGRSISEVCESLIKDALEGPEKFKAIWEFQREQMAKKLVEMEAEMEKENLIRMENKANLVDPLAKTPLTDIIETAVERAVRRALQKGK